MDRNRRFLQHRLQQHLRDTIRGLQQDSEMVEYEISKILEKDKDRETN